MNLFRRILATLRQHWTDARNDREAERQLRDKAGKTWHS